MPAVDPIALAQDLIRCPSVTPEDAGAIAVLEAALKRLGFTCHRVRLQAPGSVAIENLYARIGTAAPHFCYAGHTDVVPPGDAKLWRHAPFDAQIHDGVLYGRGAADMKSSIAAFVAAAAKFLAQGKPNGSISLLITGDEEGIGTNGTKAVLEWLTQRGERIDHCVVGEPTATARPGDTIKIGRRGSMSTRVTVTGTQGHVGYPRAANNPIPALASLIGKLSQPLDDGTAHFDPSTLAFTSVDVGNPAANVIPAEARAHFNIRFNDLHTPESLKSRIARIADDVMRETGTEIVLESIVSGVAFLTKPGPFVDLLRDVLTRQNNEPPTLSTTGGTSDARFIKDICPVAEIGLPGGTMHKADECASVADVHKLTDIYGEILRVYFANPPK
ncbi:MAG TPA: succinyl-diaminopimelate desuccinylase [Rhizomicrobium sp.]|nr:succinyl-diaminopimelate desuccinylase [Rhizomicrobium sp.]